MEFNFILIYGFRILCLLIPIILIVVFSNMLFKYKNNYIFFVALMIAVLGVNVYFMFVHNNTVKAPLVDEKINCSQLYEPMKKQCVSSKSYLDQFSTENNFFGNYFVSNGKKEFDDNSNNNVISDGDYLYYFDKNLKSTREKDLFYTISGYVGSLYIYNKKDDITVVINYEMLANDDTDKFFNYQWYSSAGVKKDFSLKNIEFYE